MSCLGRDRIILAKLLVFFRWKKTVINETTRSYQNPIWTLTLHKAGARVLYRHAILILDRPAKALNRPLFEVWPSRSAKVPSHQVMHSWALESSKKEYVDEPTTQCGMDTVLDFSLKRNSPGLRITGNTPDSSTLSQMDLSSALSALIKPQPRFTQNLNFHDHAATLMALANFKYQLPNYGLPQYAQSLITPPLGATANFTSNLPTALASAVAAAVNGSTNASQLQNSLTTATSTGAPPTKRPKLETLLENDMVIPIPSASSVTSSIASISSFPPPPPSPPQSASSSSSNGRISSQNSPIRGGIHGATKTTPMRKPPAPIPEEKKDDAYFERRKKNNDAAKRSRDARRQKEEHTAARAQYLEQENIQLHSQIALLKGEIAKLQMLLLTHSTNPSAVMAQLQIKTDSTGHEMSPIEPKSVDSTNHVN
uniref:BZIP domain-containing protein n=1 Tax=Acrobeloides nanus TaxID=290746 RepID=A0A914C4X1_9BILA